jgi:hypothetical protein
MPRALLAIGGTIAGLALLLSFKAHGSSAAVPAPAGSGPASGAQAAAGAQARALSTWLAPNPQHAIMTAAG